jgi:hypothetical protein
MRDLALHLHPTAGNASIAMSPLFHARYMRPISSTSCADIDYPVADIDYPVADIDYPVSPRSASACSRSQ